MGQAGLSDLRSTTLQTALAAVTAAEVEQVLFDLIAIESHSDTPGAEMNLALFIRKWFQERGIQAWLEDALPGRPNVIAVLKGNSTGASLLLNGHLDTVPPYRMVQPFTARKHAGKIYGRGSVDMKGALAAMMTAMFAIQRAGGLPCGALYFAATAGEETYSPGAWHLVQSGFTADYAIVGEPTELQVGVAHKGVAWYVARFKGVTAHGSVPEQGVNAIYHAARWIANLEAHYVRQLKQRTHPLLGAASLNVGTITGGTRPVIVPGSCTVGFERRLLPGETAESALGELQETVRRLQEELPEIDCEVQVDNNFHGVPHGPLETAADGQLAQGLLSAVWQEQAHADWQQQEHAIWQNQEQGSSQSESWTWQPESRTQQAIESQHPISSRQPIGLQFWTDAALLQRCCGQTVVCGPGSIARAHADEEYIEADQLLGAARIYVRAALKLCCTPPADETLSATNATSPGGAGV